MKSGICMDKTLAQRRKLSNLDIKSVAEKSGLSSAQIIAIESNNHRAFSSKLVFQMSEKKLLKFYSEENQKKQSSIAHIPPFLRS